jgi:predicted permease
VLLRTGRGATDAAALRRLRTALIIAQLAVSVTLAVGCGLTLRSALHLIGTDLGVDTRNIARARLAPPARTYPDADALNSFYDRLLGPDQSAADRRLALSSFPALIQPSNVLVEAQDAPAGRRAAGTIAVSSGYFGMLGIRIVRGRDFTAADRATSEPVAVISETLARQLWPASDALGKRVRTVAESDGSTTASGWRTVVGVAGDVRQTHTDVNLSDLYVPILQTASRFASAYTRTETGSAAWLASLRAAVGEIDPEVLVGAANALDEDVDRQLAGPRLLASALSAFAIIAGLLAALGNYAVVAYAIQQREREIAIRSSLGATPRGLVGMFIREGSAIVAIGLACGVPGAFAMGRMLRTQLHGVESSDPVTVLLGCLVVGVTAMVFVWWPARRVALISPAAALKEG